MKFQFLSILLFFLGWWGIAYAQHDSLRISTAEDYFSVAESQMDTKDYIRARENFSNAKDRADTDTVLSKQCTYYIGASYYYEGKEQEKAMLADKAYACYEEALKIFRQLNIPEDLAAIYRHQAELNSYAFSRHQQSLDQFRTAYALAIEAKDSLLQIQLLSDIVNELEYLEKWEEKNRMVAEMQTLLGNSSNEKLVLEAEVMLGDEAVKSGRFEEAVTFYNNALALALRYPERKNVYWVYSKLRAMAMTHEDYESAYGYSIHCVREYQKLYKDNAIQQCIPFIMHAEICARCHKKEECFRSADSLFRALDYGLDKMGAAQLYLYRGMWHVAFNNYLEAAEDYQRVLDAYSEVAPEYIFNDLKSLYGLYGRALFEAGRYEEAKEKFRCFVELCSRYEGPHSVEPARVLPRLAEAERQTGHIAEGAAAYEEAVRLRMQSARADFRYMPTSAREQHWNYISETMWQMAAYAVACGFQQNTFTAKAYDALLFSKGLLLASEKTLAKEIEQLGDTTLSDSYQRLLAVRKQMITAESKGDKSNAALHFATFNQLERDVMLRLAQRGGSPMFDEISGEDIAHALRKGEVVVDFTDYQTEEGDRRYVAYLLSPEWKYPKLVSVAMQSSLDSLLQQVDGRFDRLYEPEIAEQLLHLVWEPLVAELPKAHTIYYIPSGILHQISFASLPIAHRRLLGDKYNMVCLSSAKEVLSYNEHRTLKYLTSAVLYGGLDYDMDPQEMAEQSARYQLPDYYALRGVTKKNGSSFFKKIVYSEDEVIAIEEILTLNNIDVRCYRGKAGTEESFLSLTGKAPQLLQLSTHGYYYTPEEARSTVGLSGYKDMMYLTGLVMAGGNAEWQGKVLPDGVRGGLLSSADISRIDLNGVELAVLSACETGRGKATNEGLYGLQRAFKKAGAQTLVMSLWKVSDLATKDFMVAFYTHLVNNGWNKREAFRKAKNEIRKKYEDPAYWAGFVMVD